MNELTRAYKNGYKAALSEADVTRLYPYNVVYAAEGDDIDYEITPKQIQLCMDRHISERESQVLIYRYRMNLTLEETGRKYGVTKERIRQIEERALRKLRSYLREYRVEAVNV